MVVIPWIIFLVFPGLPIFFHLIMFLFSKTIIENTKVTIINYLRHPFVQSPMRQTMFYNDIVYVYHLSEEIDLLCELNKILKKYKISKKETDFSTENLKQKYKIPEEAFKGLEKAIEENKKNYTLANVLITTDMLTNKYKISKADKKLIKKGLKDNKNFNMDYLQSILCAYAIEPKDIAMLKDEFSQISNNTLTPFFRTKLNIKKYIRIEKMGPTKLATGIILSNEDGTKKAYFLNFYDLNLKNCRYFVKTLKEKNPKIKFLMRKPSLKVLFGSH